VRYVVRVGGTKCHKRVIFDAFVAFCTPNSYNIPHGG
jgi:hypothetical protein